MGCLVISHCHIKAIYVPQSASKCGPGANCVAERAGGMDEGTGAGLDAGMDAL